MYIKSKIRKNLELPGVRNLNEFFASFEENDDPLVEIAVNVVMLVIAVKC